MIRNNEVEIKRYLPEFLNKDIVFSSNCESQSEEHERLRLQISDVFDQFFIEFATWGIDIWEETCGLPNGSGKNIETRRANVQSKLMGTATTTKKVIERIGRKFVICEEVKVVERYADYFFYLQFTNADQGITGYNDLAKRIEEIKPAHLGYGFSVQRRYFSNLYIADVTHKYRHLVIHPAKFDVGTLSTSIRIGQARRVSKHLCIGVGDT